MEWAERTLAGTIVPSLPICWRIAKSHSPVTARPKPCRACGRTTSVGHVCSPPARHPRHRACPHPRRSLGRPAAGRSRRRRHQGGEARDGDDTRKWGPPFVTSHDGENLSAAYYHACNRGKRSICVDFSTPEGAETIRKLVASADVLIENFKLGGLEKIRPRL